MWYCFGSTLNEIFFSVMQPDGNSHCEDVVLDSFNKTIWDEDYILDQIYRSKYVLIISMMLIL